MEYVKLLEGQCDCGIQDYVCGNINKKDESIKDLGICHVCNKKIKVLKLELYETQINKKLKLIKEVNING